MNALSWRAITMTNVDFTIQCVYKKKRLVFEIQISHNYSDLIVLNCVELRIRDENLSAYLQKRSIITSF
jgi:hypothetical protein